MGNEMAQEIKSFEFSSNLDRFMTQTKAEELLRAGMFLAVRGGGEIVAFLDDDRLYTFQRKPFVGNLPEVLRCAEYCILRTATGRVIATCVMYPDQS